jgi:hypothetical protein
MADREEMMRRLTEAKARSAKADRSTERPRRDIDWMDVLKSTATGARKGLESTLGGVGDIGGLQKAITSYGARRLGVDPETAESVGKYTNPLSLFPNTEDVSGASDQLLGRDAITRHEPTTPQGKNISSFSELMSGLVGGPENLGKDMTLKLAMAMIPASKLARKGGIKLAEELAAPGTKGMKAAEGLADNRISQRFPTSPNRTEDPLSENLLINMDVLKQDPKKAEQAADIVSSYPATTNEMKEMAPAERLDAFRDSMKGNYTALWDMMGKANQERASNWYLGANRIAGERAKEVGISPAASAATYAALSPQKDWFMNVHLGDSVLRALQADPKVTPDMMRMAETLEPYQKGSVPEVLRGMEGRRLSDMSPQEQALAIRLHEQTYGARGSNSGRRSYRQISPEGDYGDIVQTKAGEPRAPTWGSFSEIQKAVEAAQSGGDTSVISPLMGLKHKVRNFYNNIVAPVAGEKFGDITADTHQIAAGLFRPLTGNSPEVMQGLQSGSAGVASGPQSVQTGLQGLYPIYADATRMAAAERGVPTRAMQSTPWEAIRSLYPPEFKRPANMAAIDDIWAAVGRGEVTPEQARQLSIERAGGFKPPQW